MQRFIGAGAGLNVSEASFIDRLKIFGGLLYWCFNHEFGANLFDILRTGGLSIDFDIIDQFQMIILFGYRVNKTLIQ